VTIRAATDADVAAIWGILEPMIRAGETYALPRDMSLEGAFAFWRAPGNDVFVAEDGGQVLGTYFFRRNHMGGGSHVGNCGYVTHPNSTGKGIARAMCLHSIEHAKSQGYKAIQFNFVVSTNERAVRLWQSCGFEIVGCLPGAFHHPIHGFVDVFVMYLMLGGE
jgi:ribosomal protein S18 acetylase RimI-like enzyme